jgi:hypothetical protein
MTNRILFCFFVSALIGFACTGHSGRDVRAYYFPVESLDQGKVYAYESTQNGVTKPEYWYYHSVKRDSGLFLQSTYYDEQGVTVQAVREKIVANGSLVRDYFLMQPDSAGTGATEVRARIESGSIFPFQVHDSTGVFLFSLNFHPPNDPKATVYVIRNRRFLGDAPDYEFKGKKYPCIRFGIREAIGNEKEGASEVEGVGEEWYAKGLGLVYYRKVFGAGSLKQETFLRDTFARKEGMR